MFFADRIVTHDFAALGLMLLYFGEADHLRTVRALDSEGMDDLFHHSRGSSDFNVFMAHGAIFVQNKPVFNAKFAEQLVAVVAFFCIATHF